MSGPARARRDRGLRRLGLLRVPRRRRPRSSSTRPYGAPSAPVTIGTVAGRRVAFLPRHGRHHELAPHAVPYRANVWAMQELGVSGPAGAVRGRLAAARRSIPGDFVVVDQLVDRTWGRADTFHTTRARCTTSPSPTPTTPACGRRCSRPAGPPGSRCTTAARVVVIQGPRFSTRAESRWFRADGLDVVNMTGYPEAVLAAEAGLPFAAVALVTDYDAGVDGREPVTQEAVFARPRAQRRPRPRAARCGPSRSCRRLPARFPRAGSRIPRREPCPRTSPRRCRVAGSGCPGGCASSWPPTPLAYWSLTVLVAGTVGYAMYSVVASADATKAGFGTTPAVVVAVRDVEPARALDADQHRGPRAAGRAACPTAP